jgi:hypothetical protein
MTTMAMNPRCSDVLNNVVDPRVLAKGANRYATRNARLAKLYIRLRKNLLRIGASNVGYKRVCYVFFAIRLAG